MAAQIREELGKQLTHEDTPLLRRNMQAYATRDGGKRYKLSIGWILDGVVQAHLQNIQGFKSGDKLNIGP